MKIVILDGYTENPGDLSWEGFERLGDLTVYDRTTYNSLERDLIIERAKGADAVIVNKTPLDGETLRLLAPELRYVGVLATGYNVVDVDAAKELDVTVCNVPTYGTTAVAQYTMALLLELCHHVGAHADAVRFGRWDRNPDFCFWDYPLTELAGKTFGIIGLGRIGRATAKLAGAFGMKVIAFDEFVTAAEEAKMLSLDEVLSQSDVISLHCPLFETTRGIICAQTIAKMKNGVWIINTSRGPLVNEEDMADALKSKKVGGAALDVVSTEPIMADHPLKEAPNCLITPHIAWASKESRQRLMEIAVRNLEAFLEGVAENVVNP